MAPLRNLFLLVCSASASALAVSARAPVPVLHAVGRQLPAQMTAQLEEEGGGVGEILQETGVTVLRLVTCLMMYHHGVDKVINVDGFSANVVAKFFGFLPGDPHFWTYSAAATQIVGSGLLALGVFSRPTALAMAGTMAAAVTFHLLNTGPEGFPLAVVKAHSYNFELAAMYVAALGYFALNGAGKYSVDEIVLGGEIDFYKGLLSGNKEE